MEPLDPGAALRRQMCTERMTSIAEVEYQS
jgi:hypothetical protein